MRQVIAPLLQTLEVVHQRGVIHRDIKPENLLLSEAGVVKLGDWGLAINQLQEKAYSRVGTLDYMAPEVGPLYTVSTFIRAQIMLVPWTTWPQRSAVCTLCQLS